MEEHFNENYVESEKFPKSTFKGKIVNLQMSIFQKPGVYKVTVTGDLTIHGVTKNITEPAEIEITGSGVNARSKFVVTPEEYNIEIPSVVREKIAKEITVSADVKMTPMGISFISL